MSIASSPSEPTIIGSSKVLPRIVKEAVSPEAASASAIGVFCGRWCRSARPRRSSGRGAAADFRPEASPRSPVQSPCCRGRLQGQRHPPRRRPGPGRAQLRHRSGRILGHLVTRPVGPRTAHRPPTRLPPGSDAPGRSVPCRAPAARDESQRARPVQFVVNFDRPCPRPGGRVSPWRQRGRRPNPCAARVGRYAAPRARRPCPDRRTPSRREPVTDRIAKDRLDKLHAAAGERGVPPYPPRVPPADADRPECLAPRRHREPGAERGDDRGHA